MGASVTLTGPVGAGNVTKLANQIMVACNIAAMGEALTLATKAGLDPEVVFNAVKGGLAGSTVLNAKAPMVISRNFQPGFRIALHQKDLRNALLAAESMKVSLPLTSAVQNQIDGAHERWQGQSGSLGDRDLRRKDGRRRDQESRHPPKPDNAPISPYQPLHASGGSSPSGNLHTGYFFSQFSYLKLDWSSIIQDHVATKLRSRRR